MATRKKVAAKRSASTSSRAAAPRVRNKHSVRTTNRTANRVAVDYTLPATGSLKPWLEGRLRTLKGTGVSLRKMLTRSRKGLLQDLHEMLEVPARDLLAFQREGTPVTARHMELLALHRDEFLRLGSDASLTSATTEVIGEDAEQAMAAVVRARNAFADRAKACGIPVQVFDTRSAMGSPAALHARCLQVLDAAELVLDQFDNPARARDLWNALQEAVDALGEVAGERTTTKVSREDAEDRARLLMASLYPFMLWMSQWGRVAFPDDRGGQRRWRLDKTFPHQERLEDLTPEEEVATALSTTPDQPQPPPG